MPSASLFIVDIIYIYTRYVVVSSCVLKQTDLSSHAVVSLYAYEVDLMLLCK